MGKGVLAEVLQTPKWGKAPLQECCKCFEKLSGVCRNAANTPRNLLVFCRNAASASKNFLAFAGTLQVPRKTFWPLQECCKCFEKLSGVCRDAASASKNFLAFAEVLQSFPGCSLRTLRRLVLGGEGKGEREGVETVGGEGVADVDGVEAADGTDDGEP